MAPVSDNATFDVGGVVATLPAAGAPALGEPPAAVEPQAAAASTTGT